MPFSAVLLLLAARAQTQIPAPAPPPGERPLVAEKKWALCVGAGAYTDLAPLKYSPNDARAFAKTLREGYGFDPSTVGLISDGEAKVPTSANILGELDRLLADRRLDRGDLFVFYFSGHGVGKPSGDYLMPIDVPEADAERAAIPVRSLIERFVRAGLKNVLVVADACRSGARNPFGRELQELGRKANIAVLLGCAPGQRSYEYPRLEKGVFTHFLVRAMADRSLAEKGSGALWASAVAKKVAGQVKEYTEADYGEEAQTPAVWSEPSQDVLLAAYAPENAEAMEAMGGKLEREPYGRYLSAMGQTLTEEGRPLEAIQAFKTLDGLGLATWRDLGALAIALRGENRDNEVGSLVGRAVRESVPTFQSERVVLLGQTSYVGAARYRQALKALTDADPSSFNGAALYVKTSRLFLRATDAEIAQGLAPYRPKFATDSMEGRFLAANIAMGGGRYAEGLALAELASAMPEGKGARTDLRQVRYEAAGRLMQEDKVDAIIAEGVADPEDGYPWITRQLRRMKARKDPGLLDAARAFGAKTDSDPRMSEVLVALGADAGALRAETERLAAAHPYSWQAPMNVWLATAADDFKVVPAPPEAAFKYAPNKGDLVRIALNRFDDTLETAREDGRVSGIEAALVRNQLVGWYSRYWEDIKDAPIPLLGMGRVLMRSPLSTRGAFFASEFLWPYAQKQEYARQELMTVSLYLALNGADEPLAKAIFGRLEKEGLLSSRAIIRYAAHQALAGQGAEAERAIGRWSTLGVGEPNATVAGDFLATRALLAAKRGDGAEAKALIGKLEGLNPEFQILALLARYEADGRKGLSEELTKFLIVPNAEFSDFQVAATVSAMQGYAADPSGARKGILENLSLLLCDYPGHPWAQAIGFNGLKGIEHWVGKTWWNGTLSDGVAFDDCTLKLDIDPKGVVTGRLEIPGDEGRYFLNGTVDSLGNMGAMATDADGREIFGLAMKLPTTEAAARLVGKETSSRALLFSAPWRGGEIKVSPVQAMTAADSATEAKRMEKGATPKSPTTKKPAPKKPPAKKPLPKRPGKVGQ